MAVLSVIPLRPVFFALLSAMTSGFAGRAAEVTLVPAEKPDPGTFVSGDSGGLAPAGPLYAEITYLDSGYGRLEIRCRDESGGEAKPDRALGVVMLDSGRPVTAYVRFPACSRKSPELRVTRTRGASNEVPVSRVLLRDTLPADAHFRYLLDEAWRRPYDGPTVPAPDNTTLKGKVMVGYQGWFRTPNDPYDRGWVHWGDMSRGAFNTDMWPDISFYPASTLDKAGDVKLRSGAPARLFSSAWPEVAREHFRRMREHGIDGAFLQRFVNGDSFAVRGEPQWVLAAVREAAAKEGRVWAIEYDLSGVPDEKMADILRRDWTWLVDVAGITRDANYARVGGNPVVFLWGPGVGGRHLTPASTAAALEFFKNDPKYGGNHVLVGAPGNWRRLGEDWKAVYAKFDGLLAWMSRDCAGDLAECRKLGLDYYPHAWPGFSWAHLKHIPTGSTSQYTPRERGAFFEGLFTKAISAGADRLFVGMFDEYDEGTAILPMSDDTPATPERPGIVAKFYPDPKEQEHAVTVLKSRAELTLSGESPAKNIPASGFLMRWEGLLTPPESGEYTLAASSAQGDAVKLWIDDRQVGEGRGNTGQSGPVSAKLNFEKGRRVVCRIEVLHGDSSGVFRLSWKTPSGSGLETVPDSAFTDAWGRFITNEGLPSDHYLKLTGKARTLLRP